jgi:hypothetical protein
VTKKLEKIVMAAVPAFVGVIAAGLAFAYFGRNTPLLKEARRGFDGANA